MSACLRCKLSKLRCIKPEGAASASCERCARAGIACIPTTSRQGKRTRPEDDVEKTHPQAKPATKGSAENIKSVAAPHMPNPSADVLRLVHKLAKELGPNNSTAYFILGFFQVEEQPQWDATRWLLRNCAELATSCKSHAMFKSTLEIATALGVSIADVAPTRPTASGAIRISDQPLPSGLPILLDSIPGFVFARGADLRSDGSVPLYTNRAFEDFLCSAADIRATWAINELPMLSRFVHKSDL